MWPLCRSQLWTKFRLSSVQRCRLSLRSVWTKILTPRAFISARPSDPVEATWPNCRLLFRPDTVYRSGLSGQKSRPELIPPGAMAVFVPTPLMPSITTTRTVHHSGPAVLHSVQAVFRSVRCRLSMPKPLSNCMRRLQKSHLKLSSLKPSLLKPLKHLKRLRRFQLMSSEREEKRLGRAS